MTPDDDVRPADNTTVASDEAPLRTGQRVGIYQIRGLLGKGGMGEVYRAYDTRLGREVAIKVLPPGVTGDPVRLARFEREARMLASLNHPNIAAIYDVEDASTEAGRPIRTLILELVEGSTLADALALGPMKPSTAITYAIQIAQALEAAHEKGIVHRDIKPANIKVGPQGTIKVLDFGLAAPVSGATDAQLTNSPTVGERTASGILMGTVPYMSPEQASGLAVDRRTDVWAFGCVLYEMLTGKRAFAGTNSADTLVRIMTREPDWNALPAGLPDGVLRVLRRALAKDPQQRLRDLGDARFDLQAPTVSGGLAEGAAPSRRRLVVAMVGVALTAAAAGGALSRLLRTDSREPPRSVSRFSIAVEPHEVMPRGATISPDGRYVAYVAGPSGNQKNYLRRIGDAQSRLIGELGLQSPAPFFSPDSQWVAFFDAGKLKKVPIAGGSAVTLADAPTPRGGTWCADGSIVFAPISRGGLARIPAAGGSPQALTTLDRARGETSHRQPSFVPESNSVLFVADTTSDLSVQTVSLDSKQVEVIQGGDAAYPRYVPTGHLTYQVDRRLVAAPFDPATLQVRGPAVTVVEGVEFYSFSASGTLVFAPADSSNTNIRASTLVWVDRNGRVTPLPPPVSTYEHPRLSADARTIVVARNEPSDRHVWKYDIGRDTLVKLTFESSNDWPVWSADGRKIFYGSNRAGTQYDIVARPVDGSGPEEVVLSRPLTQLPRAAAPSGDTLVFEETYPDRPNTLWRMPLPPGSSEPRPLLGPGNGEMMPAFSPDGRWIAYVSPQSGRAEIHVRSSTGEGSTWQVSSSGGVEPVWASGGRELLYRADDKMMTVGVSLGATPVFAKPRVLFEGSYIFGSTEGQAFDVTRDGQRFLMLKPQRPLTAVPLSVIVNWFDALREQVPAQP